MLDGRLNKGRAVILTALAVEYEAVRSHLNGIHEETHKGTVYERGTFLAGEWQWEVGIAQIGAGSSRAAFEAERAIAYFRPSIVLFVGVALGLKDIVPGDVVVATKVYGYESAKDGKEQFRLSPDVGESSYRLVQRALAEGRKRVWIQRIRGKDQEWKSTPRVVVGPIAAGRRVMPSTRSNVLAFLHANYNDALAVEMEGRGFLHTTHGNEEVQALIVRGISDVMAGQSVIDVLHSQEIAARHASAFAFEILAKLDVAEFHQGEHLTNEGSITTPSTKSVTETLTAVWPPNIPDEPYYYLPVREQSLNKMLSALQDPHGPSTIVIDGLGGLGKTAIAVELARSAVRQGLFEGVVGESAKQELFAGGEIIQLGEATLDFELLLDSIARQLGRWEIPTLKLEEKRTILAQLLRQHRYLILVDNLETVENANVLVALLRSFLGGNRAIVTSRKKVPHDFVQSYSLQGLELEDSLAFLQKDIEKRGVQQLQHVSPEKLVEIHIATGGAPLAMKLVVAQTRSLDLDRVLERLQRSGVNLYSFIFRQSWEQLSSTSQHVLIYIGRTVMTTVSWDELASVGIAEDEEKLIESIDQLVAYSLLDVSSATEQARYGIHQLTRQFVNSDLPEMWRKQGLL